MLPMEKLVSLCKRRGFLFQSSEIYGGINGFWDYGPLGVELKRNVRNAWWHDMITAHDEFLQPAGAPSTFEMCGVETSIIMHPKVWQADGNALPPFQLAAGAVVMLQRCFQRCNARLCIVEHHQARRLQMVQRSRRVQQRFQEPLIRAPLTATDEL